MRFFSLFLNPLFLLSHFSNWLMCLLCEALFPMGHAKRNHFWWIPVTLRSRSWAHFITIQFLLPLLKFFWFYCCNVMKRHFHLAILQEFFSFLWRIMWTFTSECARNLITNRFNLRSPMNNFCIWPPIAIVKKLWQWRCTKCSEMDSYFIHWLCGESHL